MNDKGFEVRQWDLLLWKDTISLPEIFNQAWNHTYMQATKDGDLELDVACRWEDLEDYRGKALLPEVYVDYRTSLEFKEKVLEFVKVYGYHKNKVHITDVRKMLQ